MTITNQQIAEHSFLSMMYGDDYFPNHLVDKGKAILLRLCERIEAEKPRELEALYALTTAATDEFNELELEFDEAGSEFETSVREEIGEEFWFIAKAYGLEGADVEAMIATRDW